MRLVIFLVSSLLLVALIVFNMYFPRGWLSRNDQPEPVVTQLQTDGVTQPDPISKTISEPNTQPHNTSPKAPDKDPQWVSEHLIIEHQVSGTTRHGGRYWIFELVNLAEADMLRPGVMVSLFDADGQRLAEQGGWSFHQRLKTGEKTQVLVFIDEPPATATSETITPMASLTSIMANNQLAITVKDHIINEKNGQFEVIGDVLNEHDTAVKFPRVVVVPLDAAGRAIGLGQSFSTQKALESGEVSGFKVRLGTFMVGEPDSWLIYALAQTP